MIKYLLYQLLRSRIPSPQFRAKILRSLGASVGEGVFIEHSIELSDISKARHLILSDRVFINSNVYFDTNAVIYIGEAAAIAPFVRLVTTTHDLGKADRDRLVHGVQYKSIVVGSGSWIAVGVTVLPGARILQRTAIAAGAVVLQDSELKGDALYAGIPAKKIKNLDFCQP